VSGWRTAGEGAKGIRMSEPGSMTMSECFGGGVAAYREFLLRTL
jgi:hypothetical protein